MSQLATASVVHFYTFYLATDILRSYFERVPVIHIIICVSLSVKEIPKQLPQVGIVWFVIKSQGSTEVQVGSKFS